MSESDQGDILSGVGITALGAAAARAIESSRPDRLMDDPFAAAAERYGRDIADPGLPHLRTAPSAPAGLTVGAAAETIRTSFLSARRPD